MLSLALVPSWRWLVPGLAAGLGVWLLATMSGPLRAKPVSGDSRSDADTPFAVVELFTSQGCSSCPSADRNLRRLVEAAAKSGDRVLALSFHVDYWNRLGWTDPHSHPDYSARQSAYARAFDSEGVYTPQMIVNGTVEFVGSDQDRSDKAIAAALQQTSSGARLKATAVRLPSNAVEISYSVAGASPGDELSVALVRAATSNTVPRGENAGRTLQHVHVVAAFKSLPKPGPQGRVTLDLPAQASPGEFAVIAFLQNPKSRAIHAATQQAIE